MSRTIKDIIRPYYRALMRGIPQGYIFMLHRVENKDPSRLFANENMKISPEYLDAFLKRYNGSYDFIRTDEIPQKLTEKSSRKFMAFTMDDGYRDNITRALPIFKANQTPFTIFVASDFADKTAVMWWYVIEDIILNSERIVLSGNREFVCNTKQQKEETFMKIRSIILGLNQNDLENELNNLFQTEIDWKCGIEDLAVTWDDINRFKGEPLLTIGGHTKRHCNLKQLNDKNDVKREIIEGIDRIRNCTGIQVEVFAYPYGSHDEVGIREIETVAESGLSMACIADGGCCLKKHRDSLFSLPRIMLTDDFNESQLS